MARLNKNKSKRKKVLFVAGVLGFLLSDRFESKDNSVLEKKTKRQMLPSRGS